MAVIYQPIAAPKLYACVHKLAIKNAEENTFTHKKLLEDMAHLSTSGFLERSGNRFIVADSIAENLCRQLDLEGQFTLFVKVVREFIPVGQNWNRNSLSSARQGYREIRMAIYAHQLPKVIDWTNSYIQRYPTEFQQRHPILEICFEPLDSDWLIRLPTDLLTLAVNEALYRSSRVFSAIQALLEWILKAIQNGRIQQAEKLSFMCAGQFLLCGDLVGASTMNQYTNDYDHLLITAWLQFIKGDNDDSIKTFEAAIALDKKMSRKRKVFISNLSGLFFLLALIKSNDPGRLEQARQYSAFHRREKQYSNPDSHKVISRLLGFLMGKKTIKLNSDTNRSWQEFYSTLFFLLHGYCLYWTDKKQAIKLVSELKKFALAAEKSRYKWMAAEAWQLLAKLDKKGNAFQQKADVEHQALQTQSLIGIVRHKQEWEHVLDAMGLIQQGPSAASNTRETRLAWFISGLESSYPGIQPKLQKRTARGGWSKGRNVSLRRLKEDPQEFKNLCQQDNRARQAIREERAYDYYYGSHSFELDTLPALQALAGHPYLFDSTHNERKIELISAEPEIRIRKMKGEQLFISMEPELRENHDFVLEQETVSRWKIINFNAQHQQLSDLLGAGLKVPLSEKQRVLAAMSSIAPLVNIHSDIGGEIGNLETVVADSQLHILLSPAGDGFSIEARSRIFGERGPYYPPGVGSETIITEIDGKRLQTQRNLEQEKQQFNKLLESCPALMSEQQDDFHWFVNEAQDCLEILSELQRIKGQITISWPKGEALRIRQQASMKQFSLSIKGNNDWFSASGELSLDDGEVLNIHRLLALSANAKGRFIELEDGQFIALSKTFQKRLNELNSFGEVKGDVVQLHPLAALTLEELAEEAGQLKAGKNWKTFSQRFEHAMALQPEVPSTLQAELRDYQQQGFCWLARLAHWGAGACLADDMGLGKTLQALALILYRTMNGPSLVVAPTSVSLNWMDEIQRFAPTLNIIDIRETKTDGEQPFQPFDIVISSYGLLQTRSAQLQKTDWQTIVLDEAQAIKNPGSKRSQAVMKLGGQFKLITTGTPIENHLGELWNLFRFINPGLLGSLERFNTRFALPISRDDDPLAGQQLKKLIQPFILRRTKTQVLKELPARTEIVMNIEMNKGEARLYEALRREAIDKFSADSEYEKKGHRQLQILAEITRLRQACCNPRLVIKQGAPESSKLVQFTEMLEELLENNHKALVFSQFVGHLKILEQHVKDKGIRYQYLDGSTPVKERKKRVNAFQAGEGDVFLISLKAGGVGLNLTAADYVIHMDPWWNPAVEDQASDRAHRIGQTRPVTVYRMVMKDTIEEKIIALHHQKRDLADNLLAGADVADKLNAEDLLALLKEE